MWARWPFSRIKVRDPECAERTKFLPFYGTGAGFALFHVSFLISFSVWTGVTEVCHTHLHSWGGLHLPLLPATSRKVVCFIMTLRVTCANFLPSVSCGAFELSPSGNWCSPTLGMRVPAGPYMYTQIRTRIVIYLGEGMKRKFWGPCIKKLSLCPLKLHASQEEAALIKIDPTRHVILYNWTKDQKESTLTR